MGCRGGCPPQAPPPPYFNPRLVEIVEIVEILCAEDLVYDAETVSSCSFSPRITFLYVDCVSMTRFHRGEIMLRSAAPLLLIPAHCRRWKGVAI